VFGNRKEKYIIVIIAVRKQTARICTNSVKSSLRKMNREKLILATGGIYENSKKESIYKRKAI